MSRLNKSGIDYLTHTWNFYTGCHNHTKGICKVGNNCYAKKQIERFEKVYPNGFEPTFYYDSFLLPLLEKRPERIGIGFLGDLFGDWVDPDKPIELPEHRYSLWLNGDCSLRNTLFAIIKKCPQHTFVFLTKCYWNLPKWGKFPDNCWVGMTNCGGFEDLSEMMKVQAKVRFVSYEPMYDYTKPDLRYINWVIIGGQTRPNKLPNMANVNDLVNECDKLSIPVFLKENLRNGIRFEYKLRQEFPKI